MSVKINSHVVNTTFNGQPQVYQNAGTYRMEVPQSSIHMAKPISYDFRVAEYVNDKSEIVKVGLQYRVWEHDNYGTGYVVQDWVDVERVKVNL